MPMTYTQEQLWKLFEKLPDELKEAVFSTETANDIWDICARNDVTDERGTLIARLVGRTLLGVLPPEDFQKTLEKEAGLETELAKKIANEIHRFIFFPVKTLLETLYKIETKPAAGAILPKAAAPAAPTPPPKAPAEEKPGDQPGMEEKPEGADVYRETLE